MTRSQGRRLITSVALLLAMFLHSHGADASTPPVPSETPVPAVLPLAASPLPDVTTLRAAIAQGRGRENSRETSTIETVRDGKTETETDYTDGKANRSIESDGTLESQDGRTPDDGSTPGVFWHMNENGEVVIDQERPGKAKLEAFDDHVERAPAPFDGFVLIDSNGHGISYRSTVDRTTGHVVKYVTTGPMGSSTETFDDFRTTGTETTAWHATYEDGHAENASETHVKQIDVESIPASELAMPAGRELVEFTEGKLGVPLPVTYRDGKFFVRVVVAGRGLDFALDTGAESIAIDEDVARQLGLPILSRSSNGYNAGRYTSTTTIVPEMKVGSLVMHHVVVDTIPHLGDDSPGEFRVVGLLGFDFLAGAKFELDYQHGTVTAFGPDVDLRGPFGVIGHELPIRLGEQSPETDIAINGALGERFSIDTGADLAFLIFDYFARRHPEAMTGETGFTYNPEHFEGVGGEIETKAYRFGSVKLGDLNFSDFVGYRVVGRSYGSSSDGVIGSDLLRLFTVDLDYPNAEITLYLNDSGKSAAKVAKPAPPTPRAP